MIQSDSLMHLIRQRRTVKPVLFTEQKIFEAIIDEILESANWAPNHGRTEPWRLSIFSGAGLSKYVNIIEKVFAETADHLKKPEKLEKWCKNAPHASHIIAFGLKRTENCKIPAVEEVCAVSCAAQNMMLVATAHGVGSYWSSGIAHMPTAAAAFGLEGEEDQMLGFLHLGYFEGDFVEGCRRSSIEEKVTRIYE